MPFEVPGCGCVQSQLLSQDRDRCTTPEKQSIQGSLKELAEGDSKASEAQLRVIVLDKPLIALVS
jgi:hypothetical protein